MLIATHMPPLGTETVSVVPTLYGGLGALQTRHGDIVFEKGDLVKIRPGQFDRLAGDHLLRVSVDSVWTVESVGDFGLRLQRQDSPNTWSNIPAEPGDVILVSQARKEGPSPLIYVGIGGVVLAGIATWLFLRNR